MKIQSLAIIFVIIILPITLIIGEYAATQIEIFRLENLYDSRLITSTEDALKAFQLNTFNDATSDIADSKISSIEASANAFYNSMETSFGMQGYSKEDLQLCVPALVYTMYDGYYIYSPYTNITDTSGKINLDSENIDYGFKPYVYYSCRYKIGNNSDFIINYSLDNHITVQGIVNGENVYKSGYLVTIATSRGDNGLYRRETSNGITYEYDGVEIKQESNLTEILVEKNGNTKEYKYIKINGTKYYWDETNKYIFHIRGVDRVRQASEGTTDYEKYVEKINNNASAIKYYEEAYKFTDWINDNLSNLKTNNAITKIDDDSKGNIFENSNIEYPNSNFNTHRKEVIRYCIETNLSVAIANFNKYTNSGTNFQMPKLKETEWDLLESEVSIISFLQGLNLGGKIYNGYTVVTNSKTEEVIKEDRIYITTTDGYYHKINDKHFASQGIKDAEYDITEVNSGVYDLDFEIRKDAATGNYYTQKNQLGCYTSIVGQENVDYTYDSIYEYLRKANVDNQIKRIYYTALGRERWGTYKTENPPEIITILKKMDIIQ